MTYNSHNRICTCIRVFDNIAHNYNKHHIWKAKAPRGTASEGKEQKDTTTLLPHGALPISSRVPWWSLVPLFVFKKLIGMHHLALKHWGFTNQHTGYAFVLIYDYEKCC